MKLQEGSILIGDLYYPYIIERKKIKNIYFRVKEDLKLHISVHPWVSEKEIHKLIIKNSESILKMYQKQINKDDDSLRYLGQPLDFVYQESKPYIEGDIIYGKSPEVCQKYIESLALDFFQSRLNQIVYQFDDLPEFRLRVRKMTSRWGVCNKKSMTVTLNTNLISKEVHLIDYVIVHELCHFKHMDHSPSYWQYVEKFYPYYKKARKELKY